MVSRRTATAALLLAVVACGRTAPYEGSGGLKASTIWIDRGPDVGQYDSLAADSQGTPHVSYYDYRLGDLKYAYLDRQSGLWEIEVVDQEGDVGLYTSIALDSQDYPHIVYYDKSNDYLKYAVFNGIEWRTSVVFSQNGGLFAALALDANDVAHIAFVGRGFYDLYYMKFDALTPGAVPEYYVLDTGTLTGPSGIGGNINGGTSIKIRPDSQWPLIAYYHASFGALNVARYEPDNEQAMSNGWLINSIDGGQYVGAGQNDVGEHNSLFVETENVWHVSYYDKTSQNLRYARWDGDRWTPDTVDADGFVGESSSIAVVCRKPPGAARYCRPYISYFDSTNNDLKVATRRESESGWISFRADLSGMTGTYTSIAEVSRGRVGISYRDLTYSGLKFLLFLPF